MSGEAPGGEGKTCPGCGGLGWIPAGDEQWGCVDCNGTGHAPAPPSRPALDAVREAAERLARFGAACLSEWWENDCGDLDGATVQEYAEAAGLWHQVERHADGVECEWCGNDGSGCGELTEAGAAALDAAKGGE